MKVKSGYRTALLSALACFLVASSWALEITNLQQQGADISLGFGAETGLAYFVEAAPHPTGTWGKVSWERMYSFTNASLLSGTNGDVCFFRISGVDGSVLITDRLARVESALNAYYAEYGEFPDCDATRYETAHSGSGDGTWRVDGLVDYLWHDVAASNWLALLADMPVSPALVERGRPPVTLWTNAVETIYDPWQGEIFYAVDNSTNYNLTMPGPDGLAGTADDIVQSCTWGFPPRYRNNLWAREIAMKGLSNAITSVASALDGVLYPPWQAVSSVGSGSASNRVTAILTNSAWAYLPGSVRSWAQAAAATSAWQSVSLDNGRTGRCAWVVVNASGLLDLDVVGGTNRSYGSAAAEVELGVSASAFLSRNKHVRYESLAELASINPTLLAGPYGAECVVHSSCPYGDRRLGDGTGTNKIDISGGASALLGKRSQVIQGLTNAGIATAEAAFVFTNLLDYIDSDSIPRALDRPNVEAVPMINELSVSNAFVVSGPNVICMSRMTVEWHYPFVEASSESFDLYAELSVSFTNLTAGTGLASSGVTTSDSGFLSDSDAEVFGVKSDFVAVAEALAGNPGDTIRADFKARARITRAGGGELVDAAPYPTTNWITLPSVTSVVPPSGIVFGFTGKECIDPRFNWSATGDVCWVSYSNGPTLGAVNHATTNWRATANGVDEGIDMHVSANGQLLSVGELSNLLLGSSSGYRWKTIRLYDRDANYQMNRVLEQFTLTNGVRRGLVNVNTSHTNALVAAFIEAPIGFPGSASKVSGTQATNIAQAVIGAGSNYLDVADIGWGDWSTALPGLSDLDRESVITHSVGLLTVRDNLFTVLCVGQVYSSVGAIPVAEQALVSTVWRDGFKDGTGNHEKELEFLRWLTEAKNPPELPAKQLMEYSWLAAGGDWQGNPLIGRMVWEDMSQAVCDDILQCDFNMIGNQASFVMFSGDVSAGGKREVKRITWDDDGPGVGLLMREREPQLTYDDWGPADEWTIHTNVTWFKYYPYPYRDYTTNLPDYVDIECEVRGQARQTNRVYFTIGTSFPD